MFCKDKCFDFYIILVAKNMIMSGVSNSEIQRMTGLSIEQIESLKWQSNL